MDKNVKIVDKNHNDSDLEHEALVNMFSEIKEILEEINNKPSASELTIPPEITTRLDTILNEIKALRARNSFSVEHKEYLKFELANAVRDIAKTLGEKYSASGQAVINQLKKLEESLNEPRTTYHKYSFSVDFKNQRATATIIIMGLIIFLSGGLNIWQVIRNSTLTDSDWKYRYIKACHKGEYQLPYQLDDIFRDNRGFAKQLRKEVVQYEDSLKRSVERMEREKANTPKPATKSGTSKGKKSGSTQK